MPRILADLPEDDIKWLDARAAEQGKSRDDIGDGLEYQRAIREDRTAYEEI